MSTNTPNPDAEGIEVISPTGADGDADLWGDVPEDQRLAWLRVASRNWPFFPGATVGGLTAQSLAKGQQVRSESLVRVARNAHEAGFTPIEYELLRRLAKGRVPAHLIVSRDRRPYQAESFYEIDAKQWRRWLELVREGTRPEDALNTFLTEDRDARATPRSVDTEQATKPTEPKIEDERIPVGGDGWPRDDRPIYVNAGFAGVSLEAPDRDKPGGADSLTHGVILDADATPDQFSRVWLSFLEEEPPKKADFYTWEYAVHLQGEAEPTPMPLKAALKLLRENRGGRLVRRPMSGWIAAPNPFPTYGKNTWGELEASKHEWVRALEEFPPRQLRMMEAWSRGRGSERLPSDWIEFALRAHAVGFTPSEYMLLGTARLAWLQQTRERNERNGVTGNYNTEIPDLNEIELWAPFPKLIRSGMSLIEAVEKAARYHA